MKTDRREERRKGRDQSGAGRGVVRYTKL
ncbi:Protein of unknown function [Pyronema omphalodes CBS 100304]|uniref:Uncharacterized protein n=1 Tax=Pyronema omphalodes (strain CBS 100304) TaxID=1076935 RepID=U4KUN5_PYROM|nr:Protein of unknown function [Pyronema omphalodes CBS 100304]